jgi:hypothetical protein
MRMTAPATVRIEAWSEAFAWSAGLRSGDGVDFGEAFRSFHEVSELTGVQALQWLPGGVCAGRWLAGGWCNGRRSGAGTRGGLRHDGGRKRQNGYEDFIDHVVS